MMAEAKWISRLVVIGCVLGLAGCTDGLAGRLRARGIRGESPAYAKPQPTPTLAISTPPARVADVPESTPAWKPVAAIAPMGRSPVVESTILQATPTTKPIEAPPANPLRAIHQKAVAQYATMDSYMMQFRRREVVGNQSRPEELILLKFRQNPWSAYLKWIGNEGKGREVVFVKGKYNNQIHTLTAAGDVPFMPAGFRLGVAPDSVLVKSNSRYPITEAGISGMLARFGSLVTALEKGDTSQGTAKYLGLTKREEFPDPVETVHHVLPPRSDRLLPRGGQRWWFFDAQSHHLPVLMIAKDETGREVEYYCHDRFMFPVRLDDDDFNPELLFARAEKK